MTRLRIGQIGVRPESFWSVKCNELQLLEKFGIEVVPVTLMELKSRYEAILENEKGYLEERLENYHENFEILVNDTSLRNTAALAKAIADWAEERELGAIASACWEPMREIGNVASCFAFSELTDAHLPVVCECDVHRAITSVIAQAAVGWRKFRGDCAENAERNLLSIKLL